MARLFRHRQTKGAVNRQAEPTATAPHLYSTPCGCSFCHIGCRIAVVRDVHLLSLTESYASICSDNNCQFKSELVQLKQLASVMKTAHSAPSDCARHFLLTQFGLHRPEVSLVPVFSCAVLESLGTPSCCPHRCRRCPKQKPQGYNRNE